MGQIPPFCKIVTAYEISLRVLPRRQKNFLFLTFDRRSNKFLFIKSDECNLKPSTLLLFATSKDLRPKTSQYILEFFFLNFLKILLHWLILKDCFLKC